MNLQLQIRPREFRFDLAQTFTKQEIAMPKDRVPERRNSRARMARRALLSLAVAALTARGQTNATHYQFSFGSLERPGWTRVTPAMTYANPPGFGLEPGGAAAEVNTSNGAPRSSALTSERHFYFSAAAPEGNYKVTVTLGNPLAAAETTVNAELRRLMLEKVRTQAGQFQTRSFIVNVRQPVISTGGQVRLKGREQTNEMWAWDDRLTLEFIGTHPSVAAVEIEKAEVPTLFLIGDSTMCDQGSEPFNSWGQMITRFFQPVVAVANHAESGETIAASLGEKRFDKIWSVMKKGDYLFVQFGHNDMKDKATNALETYTGNLRKVVDEARNHGGIPVLCTSVSRRSFDDGGKIVNSFNGYPDAVRLVAREKNVPLIDLQQMGAAFYEALGPEASHRAFANARENTHHSDYGSYEIAQCVLQGIRQNNLPIAQFIVDEFKGFDPAHPDPFESFKLPATPTASSETPPGN